MSVVVLVPRRTDPERDAIWAWVRAWWKHWVGLPIFEGWDEGTEPFNRSAALNRAGKVAGDWEVAVIIDGDVIVPPAQVHGAVAKAKATGGPVQGYHERAHFTPLGNRAVMARRAEDTDIRVPPRDWRRLLRGRLRNSCSGCYVLTRGLWETVGGWDEGFVGWGYEDVAFRIATETMAGIELAKIHGPLYHFWHTVSSGNQPTSPTMLANKARCDRYVAARLDIEAMGRVLTREDEVADA